MNSFPFFYDKTFALPSFQLNLKFTPWSNFVWSCFKVK